MTDLVLLAALLRGPAHGYSLKRTAGLIFGASAIHNNILYPALRNFVRNRWVEQKSVPGERGQERKQYRITAAGRKHLLARLSAFDAADAADEGAFLLRVAFFELLTPAARNAIVEARRSVLTAQAERLKELGEQRRPASFAGFALARAQERTRGELRWVRRVEKKMREGDNHEGRKI